MTPLPRYEGIKAALLSGQTLQQLVRCIEERTPLHGSHAAIDRVGAGYRWRGRATLESDADKGALGVYLESGRVKVRAGDVVPVGNLGGWTPSGLTPVWDVEPFGSPDKTQTLEESTGWVATGTGRQWVQVELRYQVPETEEDWVADGWGHLLVEETVGHAPAVLTFGSLAESSLIRAYGGGQELVLRVPIAAVDVHDGEVTAIHQMAHGTLEIGHRYGQVFVRGRSAAGYLPSSAVGVNRIPAGLRVELSPALTVAGVSPSRRSTLWRPHADASAAFGLRPRFAGLTITFTPAPTGGVGMTLIATSEQAHLLGLWQAASPVEPIVFEDAGQRYDSEGEADGDPFDVTAVGWEETRMGPQLELSGDGETWVVTVSSGLEFLRVSGAVGVESADMDATVVVPGLAVPAGVDLTWHAP